MTDAHDWLDGLNPEQRAAVTHTGGPLLVLAGAGTGKTRTLTARVAHLIRSGTPPERILLVTFSRRAAEEMVRRLEAMTDRSASRRVHAGTFHAIANRHLRTYGEALGIGSSFTVLNPSDVGELMGMVRAELGFGKGRRFPKPETLATIYSRVVNTGTPLEPTLAKHHPWCLADEEGIAQVFRGFTERKRAQGLLDYDDLLLYWRAATTHAVSGPVIAGLYDHVLVDEYQDTNTIQSDVLRGLRSANRNITVVGDDAQSIYSFRAATVRNILDFTDHFPGASTVALEQSYRSSQEILDVANAVISSASEGLPKRLWSTRRSGHRPVLATCPDERAQCDAVCDTILEHRERGIPLRDQAVLFRAAHHSDVLEVELRRRNIPFVKFGGLKFLESAHVRDLLAALRTVDNPYDELAWFRLLQLAEGIGAARASAIIEEIGVRPRKDDVAPITAFSALEPPSARSATHLRGLAAALDACTADGATPSVQVEALRQALEPLLRNRYEHADVRLRDLDQLGTLAEGYSSLGALITDLTLDPPASTEDLAGDPLLDDDYLTLSTVHSAKGGEWTSVHVLHASDGIFPSDLATGTTAGVDEERRLFYVALTRAREHLHLYAPLRYHHGGAGSTGDAHSWGQRTRFLPKDLDALLDLRAVRSPQMDAALIDVDVHVPGIAASVDESLRGLW